MELGTGVFLSAVFLGTVGLFVATKDRWNWKKIFLWPLGVIVGLGIVGGSIAYLYRQHEDRPRKLTELWGVSLNDSAGDVKFKKGKPPWRMVDGDLWIYGKYYVYFKNDRVRSVMYFGPMYEGPSLHGVRHYDSQQELDAKLGPPSYVSRAKDGLRRAYSYKKFNIVVHFEKGEMSALGIYDPTTGAFEFSENRQIPVVKLSNISGNHQESRLNELETEIARRSKIYSILGESSDAKKIALDYERGVLKQEAARLKLQALIPEALGALPPDIEKGNWEKHLEKRD